MENEVIEKYKKAGNIAKEVREWSRELVKEGVKTLDVAEKIEAKIISLGGKMAFPTNISINSIAAHATPKINDETVFKKGDLVKIDIGVHVEGFIADTAYTIEVGTKEWASLIKASEDAVNAAIKEIKPGVSISRIGNVVEEAIKKHSFVPIANLSGHEISEYDLHAGMTIPNFNNKSSQVLKKGMAVAIEPFATNGLGQVIETKDSEIFKLIDARPVRQPIARKILDYVIKEHRELPFCKRWVAKKVGGFGLEMAFQELVRAGVLHNYPVLKEGKEGMVSQTEHTVLVLDQPIVTTL